jgi:hypothetical protein
MFGKTATVILALMFFSLCAPTLSHGLEDRSESLQQDPGKESTEARVELTRSEGKLRKEQNLFLTTSTEPVKEQQHTNSFLQDQLEQKSPVYLWVPGRGAVGVGVTMSW